MLTINHAICPECSIGCGINIISKDGKLLGINPYKNHPINEGKNCKNCIDNINNIIEHNKEKTYDYDNKTEEIAKKLNKYQNNEITIVTSGKTDNIALEKIIEFTDKNNYNLIAYEYNFTKIDKDLIVTYKKIEEADKIIIIGDIYRNNSLIARRIIHAQENNAQTININTTKNLTGYNSDQFIQIDSYNNIKEALNRIETTPKTVIIINEAENYEDVLSFVKEKNIKILPLPKNPNSYSILEKIEKTSKDEITNTLANSKLLLFINEDEKNYSDYDIKDKETIKITQEITGSSNEIPVKLWCEKEGSFTNATGTTQEFRDAIEDENNKLKTTEEVLEIINDKL